MDGARHRSLRHLGTHGVRRRELGSKRRLRKLAPLKLTPVRVWIIVGMAVAAVLGILWLGAHHMALIEHHALVPGTK